MSARMINCSRFFQSGRSSCYFKDKTLGTLGLCTELNPPFTCNLIPMKMCHLPKVWPQVSWAFAVSCEGQQQRQHQLAKGRKPWAVRPSMFTCRICSKTYQRFLCTLPTFGVHASNGFMSAAQSGKKRGNTMFAISLKYIFTDSLSSGVCWINHKLDPVISIHGL